MEGIPDREARQEKNDERVAQLAPRLLNAVNMRLFGVYDLGDIPSGVRHRAKRTLGSEQPLVQQAWKALRESNHDRAEELFGLCLGAEGADRGDDRFFSVQWGLAQIELQKGKPAQALPRMRDAIHAYPHKTREEHYIRVAEVILEINPQAITDAEAVLRRGLEVLKDSNGDGNGAACDKLQEAYRRMIPPNHGERRPPPLAAFLTREPVNRQTAQVFRGNGSES